MKRDTATRLRFQQSLRSHDTKRQFHAHQIDQQTYDAQIAGLQNQPLPGIPQGDIYLDTAATLSPNGGVYERGTLSVTATYRDNGLQQSAEAAHGADHQAYNSFDASLGEDRSGTRFVDGNTAYSFPIGMSVGQILLYEAAYQAVRHGYTKFTLGMGEGQAAQMWGERYQDQMDQPQQLEGHGLLDDRPAPKQGVSAFNFLIGAWDGLSRYWDKA